MKSIKVIILLAVVASYISCGSAKQATSTIVGGDYDAKTNTTEYFVIPYGQVSIPGKWEKTTYNSVSRQQFFRNDESINFAVSFGPCNKYEFNQDGSLKGYEFVEAFYEWDSKYFVSNGLDRKILETDKANKYIIYRVFGKGFDTYILVSEKNGNVSNFSINATDKWTEQQKVDFLKSLL
ncbi:MAG: hypothetical protein IK005_12705 [Paludibacteraceae bacterium]|nr:hypothetical protein [Paludibacteraceae bacterium]